MRALRQLSLDGRSRLRIQGLQGLSFLRQFNYEIRSETSVLFVRLIDGIANEFVPAQLSATAAV